MACRRAPALGARGRDARGSPGDRAPRRLAQLAQHDRVDAAPHVLIRHHLLALGADTSRPLIGAPAAQARECRLHRRRLPLLARLLSRPCARAVLAQSRTYALISTAYGS
jgi:hypothetical protein